jgi:release factor glutamine methyltransferase
MAATRTPAEVSQGMIAEAAAAFARAGVKNCRLDAEAMLAEAARTTRAAVLAGLVAIDASAAKRYAAMVRRRVRREPLAYIFGRKEFYSLEFEVSPAVLVPRPETEAIVSAALQIIGHRLGTRLLDIGTGSGAIALAIAVNASAVRVVATDDSRAALEIAQRNAVRLGVAARVQFRLADCFEAGDDSGPLGRFDLIVANPPYVKDGEIGQLEPEISRYEPRGALAGGDDGLDFYRRIAPGLPFHLERSGTVIFEIGANQSAAVVEIFRRNGATSIRVATDLGGLPRVVIAHFG